MRLLDDARDVARWFAYRRRYPGADISFGAWIDSDSVIDRTARVGRGSRIGRSVLRANTQVHEQCRLHQATLEPRSIVYANCRLGHVQMGSYSYCIGPGVIDHTTIGRFCSIAAGLYCGTGEHPSDWVSTSPIFYSTGNQVGVSFADTNYSAEHKPITIGHDVWIGTRVFIRDGVAIGHGAILAAGAVVTADVEPYDIVGGVPARLIRRRFDPGIVRDLLQLEWWNWSEDTLRDAQPMFVQDDPRALLAWARKRV